MVLILENEFGNGARVYTYELSCEYHVDVC